MAELDVTEVESRFREITMKWVAICAVLLLNGCYAWEYARLSDIRKVETEFTPIRVTMEELVGDSGVHYLDEIVEIEGRITHIVNKGGQPAISIFDEESELGLILFFGPNEREPIKKLKIGDTVSFKGIVIRTPTLSRPGELRPTIISRETIR